MAADDAGNFNITWSSQDQDGDNWGVYGKRYNASGLAQGGEFRVNTSTAKEQMFSSVAMDAAGESSSPGRVRIRTATTGAYTPKGSTLSASLRVANSRST